MDNFEFKRAIAIFDNILGVTATSNMCHHIAVRHSISTSSELQYDILIVMIYLIGNGEKFKKGQNSVKNKNFKK